MSGELRACDIPEIDVRGCLRLHSSHWQFLEDIFQAIVVTLFFPGLRRDREVKSLFSYLRELLGEQGRGCWLAASTSSVKAA